MPEANVKRRKPVSKTPPPKREEVKPVGYTINVSKPGDVSFLKMLLFGPPKTGKTTQACSGDGETLLISVDPDGDLTMTIQGRKNIHVVRPKSIEEIESIIKALRTTDKGRFQLVVLDSVTFLFWMAGGAEINKAFRENKDVRRPYGKAGAATAQIIHDLVNLDMDVIITAHLEMEYTEDDAVTETQFGEHPVKVAVTPMVWKVLGPGVSIIGRTFKKEVYGEKVNGRRNKETKYYVSFNDGEKSPAGSRIEMAGELDGTLDMFAKLRQTLIGE
jgi:KaiC/GvpD/RAD55 family RecA-like ATPase